MNRSESKYYNTALLMDEALLSLLEKKDFEFISVKEICEKAGVSRSTFYLHYENTSDLLAETAEMISKRFYDSFSDDSKNNLLSKKESTFFVTPEYLIPYLEFVRENKRLFVLLHKKPQLFDNKKSFDKMYSELFSPILDSYGLPSDEKAYVFEFYSRGTLAIVMKWLEEDCKDEISFITGLIMRIIGYDSKK